MPIEIKLRRGTLYRWHDRFHHAALVLAFLTLNWYPILRNSDWPRSFYPQMLLSAFGAIRRPENITENLVILIVAIGIRWTQQRTDAVSADECVAVRVNVRSLVVRTPVVYCLIALSTLSLFWTAIGFWAFLTVSN